MNLDDIKKLEGWDITTSQYNALLKIYEYYTLGQSLVILSAPKGSGKSFLIKKILEISNNKENLISHDYSNNNINYEIIDKFYKAPIIAIDNGGSDNQWFRSIKNELNISKIGFCVISSYVGFIPDFQIVKFELDKDDIDIFESICGRNQTIIKDNVESYNLWDYFEYLENK